MGTMFPEWYLHIMSGTYQATVGDRGRIVLPAALRESAGLEAGTALTVIESEHGIVLLTRAQLRDWVRRDLQGLDLVAELIAERREAAASDVA